MSKRTWRFGDILKRSNSVRVTLLMYIGPTDNPLVQETSFTALMLIDSNGRPPYGTHISNTWFKEAWQLER